MNEEVHTPEVEDDDMGESPGVAIAKAAMDVAEDALKTALVPLVAKIKALSDTVNAGVAKIDAFDNRLKKIEGVVMGLRAELDSIQGRGANPNPVDLGDANTVACPGCSSPNKINTLPAESLENAQKRHTCWRCGVPWGNTKAVERAQQQWRK